MNLSFDMELVAEYHSKSQIARVVTEDWVVKNIFCPRCGEPRIKHFENNRPVADFYCPNCNAQYELKSKNGKIGKKITDGAYETMIARITSNENPDFLFMSYSLNDFLVKSLTLVPKHFFVPGIIEKRKPLSATARRAGWTGCNILLGQIPEQGRIYIVQGGRAEARDCIIEKTQKAQRLNIDNISGRGWLFDVLKCVNAIEAEYFSLADVYRFESLLASAHPENKNIRPKIRQQLQLLRDKGVIEFIGSGKYKQNR